MTVPTPENQKELKKTLEKKLAAVSKERKADIIIYSGEIDNRGIENIINVTDSPTNDNALLLLCTPGGSADAAFKIARRFQEKYKKFYLYVYGYCKSAGTLIALGSDEIIMSDYAEFGPLDVQLQEKDEIWRYTSGLNINESLRTLKSETLRFFRTTLLELVQDAGISTKTAAEIATHLSIGFINPIVSQIDPVRVGETQRAVKIALAYGERLITARGGNIKNGELANLVSGYPDHGFVIDYQEAKKIFKNVKKCNANEESIGNILKHMVKYPKQDGTKIVQKIYPQEKKNERSNKSADSGRTRKSKRKTGKVDTANSGKIVSIPGKKKSA